MLSITATQVPSPTTQPLADFCTEACALAHRTQAQVTFQYYTVAMPGAGNHSGMLAVHPACTPADLAAQITAECTAWIRTNIHN
jgi:hypothetical protein